MKATLLALVIAVFGITTAIHADDAAPTAPAPEAAAPKAEHHEHAGKKEHHGKMKKAKKAEKEAAPMEEKKPE